MTSPASSVETRTKRRGMRWRRRQQGMNMYIRGRGSDSKNKIDKKLHKYTILLGNLITFFPKMCQRCFLLSRRCGSANDDPEGESSTPPACAAKRNPHSHKAHYPTHIHIHVITATVHATLSKCGARHLALRSMPGATNEEHHHHRPHHLAFLP